MILRFLFCLWPLASLMTTYVSGNVFTSMLDIEALSNAEKGAMDIVQQYLKEEYDRLKALKRYTKEHILHCQTMQGNGTGSQAEPLSAYLAMKRLYWMKLKMSKSNAEDNLKGINHQFKHLPTEDDNVGAAVALFRLQDTYKLDTKDLADGLIAGTRASQPLTARDCFELGKVAYELDESDYYHTLLWMQEADRRLRAEKIPSVPREEILDYLSYSMYEQGNVERALDLALQLRKLDPSRNMINENIDHMEKILISEGVDIYSLRLPPLRVNRDISGKPREFKQYERLCRREGVNATFLSQLTCYYKKNRAFLKLAPLKVEVLHLKPQILLFKNIVSDAECETFYQLARPKFSTAKVAKCTSLEDVRFEASRRRTSKIAWLKDGESDVLRAMSRRVEDMTDLSCTTAEDMQITNYGIGGQYESHYDFSDDDGVHGQLNHFEYLKAGNRIATVLFYFSQPVAGGATVFPELSFAVNATKNDAIFWFNLYHNGKGDKNTLHAGCPVLAGVKLAANKWLHEYGQEFLRPCGLTEHTLE